jgi:hypothetical protein
MKPACAGHDPELWFPSATAREQVGKKREAERTIIALQICSTCPVQKTCLDDAMSNIFSIGDGIYGGSFPYERLELGATKAKYTRYTDWQRKLRNYALEKAGLECPPIPTDIPAPTYGSDRLTVKERTGLTRVRSKPQGTASSEAF